MVLARRERLILLITAVAVGVLALDRLALTPLLDGRAAAKTKRASLELQLHQDQELIALEGQLAPRWKEMTRTGLKSNPAEAESQVLHAMRDWAEAAGVSLSLLKPDRLAEEGRLSQIVFQAAGTGTMNSVTGLLWRIRNATLPVKVTELQIGSRKDGADDLSFQLRVSTVYASARPAAGTPGARPDRSGGRP